MRMTAAKSKALGVKIAARWRQDAIDLDSHLGAVTVRLNTIEQLVTDLRSELQTVENSQEMGVYADDAQRELEFVISRFQNIVQHLQKWHPGRR